MSIMIFALFTNLLELMAFSLFSMVLLDSWHDTISKSQSNLEKMNSEALQTTSYKGDQIPDALCTAILHNRQAVSKIKSHFAVVTRALQPAVGAGGAEREQQDQGAAREVGFSRYCFDHGRRDQVKYVTTSLALLGARL